MWLFFVGTIIIAVIGFIFKGFFVLLFKGIFGGFLRAVLIFSLLSAPAAFAQKVYTLDKDAYYDSKTNTMRDAGSKPLSGIVKEFDGKKLSAEIPYKNGKQEGLAKHYYPNGKKEVEIPYKNGKREGNEVRYFENGKPAGETPYKNDKKEGIGTIKFPSGAEITVTYKRDDPVNAVCTDSKGKRSELNSSDLSNIRRGNKVTSCR